MEPGVAAAAYGVETAVEGGVGVAVAVARVTMPLRGTWNRIRTDQLLPRSSHSLSVIKGKAYIFGGEEKPREPVDNHMHVFTLPSSEDDEVDYQIIPAEASASAGDIPPPRVGHTASIVDACIYIFGGRGGKEMKPLEERGRVWVFDTKRNQWSSLDPAKGSPFPASRSYHASTSTEYPMSQIAAPTWPPADSMASPFTKSPRNDPQHQTESPLGIAGSSSDDLGTMLYMEGVRLPGE